MQNNNNLPGHHGFHPFLGPLYDQYNDWGKNYATLADNTDTYMNEFCRVQPKPDERVPMKFSTLIKIEKTYEKGVDAFNTLQTLNSLGCTPAKFPKHVMVLLRTFVCDDFAMKAVKQHKQEHKIWFNWNLDRHTVEDVEEFDPKLYMLPHLKKWLAELKWVYLFFNENFKGCHLQKHMHAPNHWRKYRVYTQSHVASVMEHLIADRHETSSERHRENLRVQLRAICRELGYAQIFLCLDEDDFAKELTNWDQDILMNVGPISKKK